MIEKSEIPVSEKISLDLPNNPAITPVFSAELKTLNSGTLNELKALTSETRNKMVGLFNPDKPAQIDKNKMDTHRLNIDLGLKYRYEEGTGIKTNIDRSLLEFGKFSGFGNTELGLGFNYYPKDDGKINIAYLKSIVSKLNEIESTLDIFEKNPELSPTKTLGNLYINRKIEEKILMAKLMGEYLKFSSYDIDMAENDTNGDVKSDKIWTSAINEDRKGGVCRHIHSEISNFLYAAGIKTVGIISTNSGDNHVITWFKDEDKYYLIDYGISYVSKDPKKLKEMYLARSGAIDLREKVADKDGKMIGFTQTSLEAWYERVVSVGYENEGFDVSLRHAKNGKSELLDGTDIKVNAGSSGSSQASINRGNKKIQGGIAYEANIEPHYATAQNISGQLWYKKGGFIVGNKVGYTDIDFEQSKKNFSSINGSIQTGYSGSIKVSDNSDIGYDATYRLNGARYINRTQGYDLTQDIISSVSLNTDINKNISTSIYGGIGADIATNNLRAASGLDQYTKYAAGLSIKYDLNNNKHVKLSGEYINKLGEESKKIETEIKYDDTSISGLFQTTDPTTNDFLLKETIIKAGISHDISKKLSVNVSGEKTLSGETELIKGVLGMNYKY